MFTPDEIQEWIDWPDKPENEWEEEPPGQTALCPYCQIDSVIGDGLGAEVTPWVLETMRRSQFGKMKKR